MKPQIAVLIVAFLSSAKTRKIIDPKNFLQKLADNHSNFYSVLNRSKSLTLTLTIPSKFPLLSFSKH